MKVWIITEGLEKAIRIVCATEAMAKHIVAGFIYLDLTIEEHEVL